jgi:indolepyruvate ferredoxin oxidoreductase alpha subunit
VLFDDDDIFANGDIGCYGLDRQLGGQMICRTMSAMGSACGMASGFGKLERFGLEQLAVATVGDSTFFHASIPPIINAVHHSSKALFVVLDNSATAMTGFQPHPGIPTDATGSPAVPIAIENICSAIGCKVEIADSFDPQDSRSKLFRLLEQDGVKVLILRRLCGLVAFRNEGAQYRVWVDTEKCLGEQCGCDRYCSRIFKCPAISYNQATNKATIDEALCNGCGFCVNVCPQGAIQRETL